VELHVTADDRTGALECAAAIADRTRTPVPVAVWPDRAPARAGSWVVDLASRHLAPHHASERAATVPANGRMVHKIDSTLRGNWAAELAARHRGAGLPVLVVPALPALGRTCVGGEVFVGERRAHEVVAGDPLSRIASSRPSDHLRACGVDPVELADTCAVSAWLRAPVGIAVADAAADATVEAIVDRWHGVDGVLLAGTSAVVGAAAGKQSGALGRHDVRPPTLVVCGSLHPVAREQVAAAAARGATIAEQVDHGVLAAMVAGTPVILCSPPVAGPVSDGQAAGAAARLLHEAAALIESGHLGTLILIGGDTAAAVLGDALVVVHGSVRPGTALVESLVVDVPVITRAGAFGDPDALVDLLWATVPR
jgi:D-threonate/D-erythronate kinase